MMEFFDIHTHILPHNDDGSSSTGESIEMLRALFLQGATRVALTPHFKAKGDEPERFFRRRRATAERLIEKINEQIQGGELQADSIPDIYFGAEVAFFNAMSNVDALEDMCISGTKFMLVEMPFERWTVSMLDELRELYEKRGITPIIAHIDRYFGCYNEAILKGMIDGGIKVQINADAFLSFWYRRRALELLVSGKVHFIGSDAHNMGKRAPCLGAAVSEMEKRIGTTALDEIVKNGNELAAVATPIFKGVQK